MDTYLSSWFFYVIFFSQFLKSFVYVLIFNYNYFFKFASVLIFSIKLSLGKMGIKELFYLLLFVLARI